LQRRDAGIAHGKRRRTHLNHRANQAIVFDDCQEEITVIEGRRVEIRQLYCCCKSYLDFKM
jgi:hypothetical protein